MPGTNGTYIWLMTSLFYLGVILVPLGLSLLFIPEKMLRITERLNHWVSTEHIFDVLNKPRYQERLIYRYHKVFGIIVMCITGYCIYMMFFYTDVTSLLEKLSLISETEFGKWLLVSLYYVLLGANILGFIIGSVILIRPSMLKTLENKANHWVEIEKNLKVLDKPLELPKSMFLNNPRIFGVVILVGAIYIIMNTKYILT